MKTYHFKKRQPTPLADQSYICQLSLQVLICIKTKVRLSNARNTTINPFSFFKMGYNIYREEKF